LIRKIIPLNGKNPESIIVPTGCNVTWRYDGAAKVYAKNADLIKEFEKNVIMAVSTRAPTTKLRRHSVNMSSFLQNMWEEYEQIKKFRRPTVIIFECNVHFMVDELLKEYGKHILVRTNSNLETKSTELKNLGVIEQKLFYDLKNLWKIRNFYAHSIIYNKKESEDFFRMKVNCFKCINDALPRKNVSTDTKFGRCCYYLISQLGRKYYEKVYGKNNVI